MPVNNSTLRDGDAPYNQATGSVFIRNFDQGVVDQFKGALSVVSGSTATVVDTDQSPGPGKRMMYVVTLTGVPDPIPIIFNKPEQVLANKIYPSFVVVRGPVSPALQRWHSDGQLEYVAGVSGTEDVVNGVSGFDQVEYKVQAWPYDIYYDIFCYARYEWQAMAMVKHMLKNFQPYDRIKVIDSLGENRFYSLYNEGDISDMGEIVDVADRLKAYMMNLRVEGELDTHDPVIRSTVSQFINRQGVL